MADFEGANSLSEGCRELLALLTHHLGMADELADKLPEHVTYDDSESRSLRRLTAGLASEARRVANLLEAVPSAQVPPGLLVKMSNRCLRCDVPIVQVGSTLMHAEPRCADWMKNPQARNSCI